LEKGFWHVKLRTNNRIRVCGGCKTGFLKDSFQPPNYICLVTLSERLLRGEKAPNGKTKLVPIHFHFNVRCLREKGFNFGSLKLGENIREEHVKHLKANGINVPKGVFDFRYISTLMDDFKLNFR